QVNALSPLRRAAAIDALRGGSHRRSGAPQSNKTRRIRRMQSRNLPAKSAACRRFPAASRLAGPRPRGRATRAARPVTLTPSPDETTAVRAKRLAPRVEMSQQARIKREHVRGLERGEAGIAHSG